MQIFSDKTFENPLQRIVAFTTSEVQNAFMEIEKLKTSHYILMYLRYEARDCFIPCDVKSELPLLYAEVYDHYKPYKPNPVREIGLTVHPDIFYDDYAAALNEIHEEIALGNTYEVNYTYDFNIHQLASCGLFNVQFDGDDTDQSDTDRSEMTLYENLLTKQKTPYNAFIKNQWDTVLSFSPELFFKIHYIASPKGSCEAHIITKPMKGTARRGANKTEDEALKTFLQNDIKNRAENVMIVDLLRNDLGRIAKTNSVCVTKLFEIETHPTVHQMTSQIEADLKDNTTLYDVFRALYPCGSITGAPKISTMNIINRLEKGRRNIYCGTIGLLSPETGIVGEAAGAVFSVPIRILQKSKHERCWKYRVGGAIVWDSDIQDEWMETITKARILNSEFQLIETMKLQNGKILYLDEHLERLEKSAKHFKYLYNDDIKVDICKQLNRPERTDVMVRLLLFKSGAYTIEYKNIVETSVNKARISPLTVDSAYVYLYHKTTVRPYYNVDYNKYYDELFFNERDELTEGSRTNIIVEISDSEKKSGLWTPPVSCGLLNGVFRQKMLNAGECRERIITKEDLRYATHIYCVNSVRGAKEVQLE
ncbi:para-aminobenzoate synthase [Spirochaetia bacterium]|nr:para-aminobenzoate synthase [Spirochaetia bacterium]